MKTQPNMVKKIINFIHFGSKEKQNKIEVQLQNKYKLKKNEWNNCNKWWWLATINKVFYDE